MNTTEHAEFGEEYSELWRELTGAYESYRRAVFHWAKSPEADKRRDLLLALDRSDGAWLRLMGVTNLLRSTEMWDVDAIKLVWRELMETALVERAETAINARLALEKAERVLDRAALSAALWARVELEDSAESPDYELYTRACLLLHGLKYTADLTRFIERYGREIYEDCGLDADDLRDMLSGD